MPVTVRDNNRIPEVIRQLSRMKSMQVKVGVFNSPVHVMRAMANEFGLGNNPERSVFRAGVQENADTIADHAVGGVAAIMRSDATAVEVMNSVGLMTQERIMNKFNDQIPPPLHPTTVAKKGTDKTWIDTGETKGMVTYQVAKRSS